MAKATYNFKIKKKEYKAASQNDLIKILKRQKDDVREEIVKELLEDNSFYDWLVSMDLGNKDLLFQWKKRINEIARRNKSIENTIQNFEVNLIPTTEFDEEPEVVFEDKSKKKKSKKHKKEEKEFEKVEKEAKFLDEEFEKIEFDLEDKESNEEENDEEIVLPHIK